MFAVENLDAKYGHVEVYSVHFAEKEDVKKTVTPIKMVDCDELEQGEGFNNEHFKIEKLRQTRKSNGWLCPTDLD